MRVLKWLAIIFGGLFVLCLGISAIAYFGMSPEEKARYDREANERNAKSLAQATGAFAAISKSLEQPLTAKTCPTSVAANKPLTWPYTVDLEGLRGQPARFRLARDPSGKSLVEAFEKAKAGDEVRQSELTGKVDDLDEQGYLPVIVTSDFEDVEIIRPRSFSGGWFDGWLVIAAWPSGEVLCAHALTAEVPSDVRYGSGTFEQAVEGDFERSWGGRLEDAFNDLWQYAGRPVADDHDAAPRPRAKRTEAKPRAGRGSLSAVVATGFLWVMNVNCEDDLCKPPLRLHYDAISCANHACKLSLSYDRGGRRRKETLAFTVAGDVEDEDGISDAMTDATEAAIDKWSQAQEGADDEPERAAHR